MRVLTAVLWAVAVLCLVSCGAPDSQISPLPTASPVAGTPADTLPTPTEPPLPTSTLAPTEVPQPSPTVQVLSPEEAVALRAQQAIEALQKRDLDSLAAMVHPVDGLRFSPYAFVGASDLVFMPAEVAGLLGDPTVYLWGVFDGSGLPIEMTFAEYYEEFVYDLDFANADEVSQNRRIGQGNSVDNAREFYPGAIVVEYHFPGIDPQYAGMDWRSLRLVFQEFEGDWLLVGVIHDEWTI